MPQPGPGWTGVRPGDAGENVRIIQRYLTSQGFAVPETGTFDQTTLDSLHRYQAAVGQEKEDVAWVAPPGPDPAVDDRVAEIYGYLAAYLSDPEIGSILRAATQQQWSEQRLQGALSKTQWWQRTSAAAREFDAMQRMDPATAASRVDAMTSTVRQAAQAANVNLDASLVSSIATQATRQAWNIDQIRSAVGAEAKRNPALLGDISLARVRQTYSDYALPYSDSAARNIATQIASGELTMDELKEQLSQQAKTMFPTLAGALDRGMSVRDWAAPYEALAQRTLGTVDIDFSDPKWSRALDVIDDKGVRRAMNLDEWSRTLKSDERYGYQFTKQAQDEAFSFVASIGRAFGKVA